MISLRVSYLVLSQIITVLSIHSRSWYYIKLTSTELEASCDVDENPAEDIKENLANKLNVSSNRFHITTLDSLTTGVITANLSLDHLLPVFHRRLSMLQDNSPLFIVCGFQYNLAMMMHSSKFSSNKKLRQQSNRSNVSKINATLFNHPNVFKSHISAS